ncbi:MAG: KamA family radical SAM protein [Candidatus Micrarchaeota archaeon]
MEEISLNDVWAANQAIKRILLDSSTVWEARDGLYTYFNELDREFYYEKVGFHAMEKMNTRACLKVMKNFLIPKNERLAGFSVLGYLWKLARKEKVDVDPSQGFLYEFLHLFKGIIGLSGLYSKNGIVPEEELPPFLKMYDRPAAIERSKHLDNDAEEVFSKMKRYPTGLYPEVIKRREENKKRILKAEGAVEEDWNDYRWQLKRVARDSERLADWVPLTDEELEGIDMAVKNRIPFGVTPYYASLMDDNTSRRYDHAIRAQVIPPLRYAKLMVEYKHDRKEQMDFMMEADTSPIDLVTRRYPNVAILKPYNTCSQICVYCQRNWEVDEVLSPMAMAPREKIEAALDWFREHKGIFDILITGGDPLVMEDHELQWILDEVESMDNIIRVRIGTRTPVVMPMRFTRELADMLLGYHKPGRRELCIVTHFEHPYEVTPEAQAAVGRLKNKGVSFYNQQVFTLENSRKFETCALRMAIRWIGVDPYYLFYAKGKKGMRMYRTPVARLLQERKEEARFLPGLTRTDEPVFNVPRLGKCHLRAWQDHDVISILPDGCRVYEFQPWEKNITAVHPYVQRDVSIYDYLVELENRGEKYEDYKNIWWYY